MIIADNGVCGEIGISKTGNYLPLLKEKDCFLLKSTAEELSREGETMT